MDIPTKQYKTSGGTLTNALGISKTRTEYLTKVIGDSRRMAPTISGSVLYVIQACADSVEVAFCCMQLGAHLYAEDDHFTMLKQLLKDIEKNLPK